MKYTQEKSKQGAGGLSGPWYTPPILIGRKSRFKFQ